MIILRVFIACVLLPLPSFALTPQASQMTITADKLVIDDIKKTAVFSGSVLVTRFKTKLRSDSLVVFYSASPLRGSQAPQSSSLTQANISKLISKGNIVLKTPEYTATSQKGEYNTANKLLTLTGNVILEQNGHRAQGEKFIYDYGQQKGRLVNGSDRKEGKQRAKLTIQLGENAKQRK